MEILSLRSNLAKLKSTELLTVLEQWKLLTKQEIKQIKSLINSEKRKTKQTLVNEIMEICQEKDGLTMDAVGEVELVCVHLSSTKKQWSVYHLSDKQDLDTSDLSRSPDKFKSRLKKQIRLYFNKNYSVSVLLYRGLLWGRVYFPIQGRKVYSVRQSLYFIYYPESPVILFSGMKASYSEFLSQCLVVCLGYEQLTEMCLTGHHYQSLAELAMNKHMQGGFARYQHVCWGEGPLNEVTSRKRKAPHVIESDKITDLNQAEKRRRLEILDSNFSENVQPTLEKVQFKVELPYRSKEVATELRDDDGLFHSCVKFKGTSVLEGLRNLATAGLATVPLPKHLTIISTRARNCFILARPGKQNDTTRNRSSQSKQQIQPDTTHDRTSQNVKQKQFDRTNDLKQSILHTRDEVTHSNAAHDTSIKTVRERNDATARGSAKKSVTQRVSTKKTFSNNENVTPSRKSRRR